MDGRISYFASPQSFEQRQARKPLPLDAPYDA